MAQAPVLPTPARLLAEGLHPTGRTGHAAFAVLALPVAALWALRAWGPSAIEGWSRGWEALATLPLALLLPSALGHALRRLNDMGWTGWWAWLFLLPWGRAVLVALLLVWPRSQRRRTGEGLWRLAGLGVAGLAGLVLALSLLWSVAPVRAGGMEPAILPGDVALLRRMPVGIERGDVVAFLLPGEERPRVARVVGLPGERVAVEGGTPVIDGTRAPWTEDGWWIRTFAEEGPDGVMPLCGNGAVGLGAPCATRRLREVLPDGSSHAVLDAGARPLDAAPEVLVPPGSFYVLGDHRDDAEDSRRALGARGTGLVSQSAVIGLVGRVLASSAGLHPWNPRGWRLGRTLERVE